VLVTILVIRAIMNARHKVVVIEIVAVTAGDAEIETHKSCQPLFAYLVTSTTPLKPP
jgi:hypothetical protein